MNENHKIGRLRKGWKLAKSAWAILRLDKELIVPPAIAGAVSFVIILVLSAGSLLIGGLAGVTNHNLHNKHWWPFLVFGLVLGLVLSIVSTLATAAVIFGATERLNGGNPTVRSSLAGAWRKRRSLALFALMMTTIGWIIQQLESRVPFAGRIALWLVGTTWSIANVFSIPAIVLSEDELMPLAATRASVRTIRQVWGESVVADLGIGLVGALSFIGYVTFWVVIGGVVLSLGGLAPLAFFVLLPLAVMGFFALSLIFSTLSGIVKAVLYHYAVTGEVPEQFNQELLRAAMTPKKARKIFASR